MHIVYIMPPSPLPLPAPCYTQLKYELQTLQDRDFPPQLGTDLVANHICAAGAPRYESNINKSIDLFQAFATMLHLQALSAKGENLKSQIQVLMVNSSSFSESPTYRSGRCSEQVVLASHVQQAIVTFCLWWRVLIS